VESVKLDECDYQPDSATPWSFPLAAKFLPAWTAKSCTLCSACFISRPCGSPIGKKYAHVGLARNSHALAGPLPYVIYSDSYDARCYARGLANAGFSGLLWAPEVRTADSIADFYRRSKQ